MSPIDEIKAALAAAPVAWHEWSYELPIGGHQSYFTRQPEPPMWARFERFEYVGPLYAKEDVAAIRLS